MFLLFVFDYISFPISSFIVYAIPFAVKTSMLDKKSACLVNSSVKNQGYFILR